MTRVYPIIEDVETKHVRPISFVCVHFSNDFEHNIIKSDCVHDPLNEFIVVDNQMNMRFDTLSQAINHGMKRVNNDLVAVVHEDVLLVPGWQSRLESSLFELEKHDPDWGIAGAVGWIEKSNMAGHWSDPHHYKNTFKTAPYCEVSRLDEQILIFRRSSGIEFDSNLPSIHNIGRDIARQALSKGLKTYAIDAPTIHKYADQNGDLIQSVDDSPKILDRRTLTYKADKNCSDNYYLRKWELQKAPIDAARDTPDQLNSESPIILLGRGGGGTRLLSTLAQDVGLFLGKKVNVSGDCIDMVPPVYRSVVRKYACPDIEQKTLTVDELRHSACTMRNETDLNQSWGFKLPELLLLLPELHLAFPNAIYVNFTRKPIGTVLRRSHMTARPDNHIGRIALKAAYRYFSRPVEQLLEDNTLSRMVITTMHQLALTQEFRSKINPDRWLEISFEDTISNPQKQLDAIAEFCGLPIKSKNIITTVSSDRAQTKTNEFSVDDIKRAEDLITQYSNRSFSDHLCT